MTTQTDKDLTEQLNSIGFSLIVLSGPVPRSADNWPCIAYSVQLQFNGKPVLTTPYKMGVGNVDRMKPKADSLTGQLRFTPNEESLLRAWQNKPHADFRDKQLWAEVAAKLAKHQKLVPSLPSVLHSLLMDGSAFFEAQSFEDWAVNSGYDTDSRKAEGIYRACDAIGRQLAQDVPAKALDAACNILADY